MKVARTIRELRFLLAGYSNPAFVPTMGNLHEGHMALVRLARVHGDVTVSSIFVNRLQFGPSEDFDSYPRTLDADLQALENSGCDITFAPKESDLYPARQTYLVKPDPDLADVLEGQHRPGFFTGVSTVVMKLLGCVQPRFAIFGEKDYQQLVVISKLVAQFCLDVEIISAPIQRAPDGLAYSSGNSYLSEAERREAPRLHSVLEEAAHQAREVVSDFANIERQAVAALHTHGWIPDYVAIREAASLRTPTGQNELIVLGAARLGTTRLIDNVKLALPRG